MTVNAAPTETDDRTETTDRTEVAEHTERTEPAESAERTDRSTPTRRLRSRLRLPFRPRLPSTAVLAVLAVLTVALAGVTVRLAADYSHARTRAAAERDVLVPAKSAAARILSYDYRHITQDAAAGSALLTGDFRNQYDTVMRQQVVPQAPKQRAIVQTEVLSAGVSHVNAEGTQAVVLVFANQTVSNAALSQPRIDQVRVRLTLDRVDGRWLVSKVDAV